MLSPNPLKTRVLIAFAGIAALGAAVLLGSCSTSSPYFDAARKDQPAHHTRDGFRNNYVDFKPPNFWQWQWERWHEGLPKPSRETTPVVQPESDFLRANATEPTLTWIGHATVLLQVASYNIITDPHLSERASPFRFAGPKRQSPAGLSYDQLPHIDLVLISHNHYDHLDEKTVKRLNAQSGKPPLFVVPLGLESWFHSIGIDNVVELDWWDRVGLGSLDIHLVPVQHWSARGLTDRNKTLWGGFYVKHRTMSFMFTGDTGYSKDFTDIRERLGSPDILAVPIGAYEPRWFMGTQHIDPTEAVKIHQDLGAKYSVGIHWGAFELTDESLDEPPRALAAARAKAGVPDDRFFVMKVGETRRLAPLLSAPK